MRKSWNLVRIEKTMEFNKDTKVIIKLEDTKKEKK
jgi:hypothetical protein